MTQGSEAQQRQAGQESHPDNAQSAERLSLYRYVTSEYADEYIDLMRLFTGTLLIDFSAAEAHESLRRAHSNTTLTVDDVENRCRQLVSWGNLVPSVRDARVATVSEWLRSRSRYQVSKLGGRVQRNVNELLLASDGAREVARELLGSTVHMLERILEYLAVSPVDVEALAGDVTTIFNNQRLFAESATDFYAFVQGRMSHYDLGGPEYAAFKSMLLAYVDLISADVARHAPAVAALLEKIERQLDLVLEALDSLPGLTSAGEQPTERSPGRTREEWESLTAWYTGRHSMSGPAQLRAAADQALGQLITNAKRMLAAAGTGVSRRADLLRLAAWFNDADGATAHRIFDAAFGAYPARHLVGGPEEDSGRAGATTSWWDSPPVDIPLSLRDRGDRAARGRASKVPDPGLDRELLTQQAEEEAYAKRVAAAELAAAGNLHGAHLTRAALGLLLDMLGDLIAEDHVFDGPATWTDTDAALVLSAVPADGGYTLIHCADGDLTIHDLELHAAPAYPAADSFHDAPGSGEARLDQEETTA
jgi:uncharacterized protein (TIGR02677 family)